MVGYAGQSPWIPDSQTFPVSLSGGDGDWGGQGESCPESTDRAERSLLSPIRPR